MVACAEPYPIVVTSNSGAPLDQNLYQTVKGMSAAAQIVADGGLHPGRRALPRRVSGARQLPRAAASSTPRRARCSTRSSRTGSRCSISGRRSCSRSSC